MARAQKSLIIRLTIILSLFAFKALGQNAPLYLAHRGANQEADENTLKAYQIALAYGVDYIETDPRLTRDGFFIIMHDPTVDRTTTGNGKVSKLSLAEIKSLRTKNGEPVPTLEEVLNFAREHQVGVYLDTKERTLSALKKMVALIEQMEMTENVILGLWQMDHLKWVEENHPELTTCISWPWPPASLRQLKNLKADWVGTLVPLATKTMIKKAHNYGLKVITLEINDPEVIQKKIRAGLDAILTDDPRLLPERAGVKE